MAYNQQLADRVRAALAGQPGLTERKMFGGIGFMLRGNMCCGVMNDELIVRAGPESHEDALARPHARPFDFTGRPMKGLLFVGAPGVASEADLADWVVLASRFALSLPAK